jgi:tetratricopeptide (TPR) repeat protein
MIIRFAAALPLIIAAILPTISGAAQAQTQTQTQAQNQNDAPPAPPPEARPVKQIPLPPPSPLPPPRPPVLAPPAPPPAPPLKLEKRIPEPRAPSKADFFLCDGYREPSKSADRMLEANSLFGLSTGVADLRRSQSLVGLTAAAACDRALGQALLKPEFWQRRAHLYQAKAMHLIAAENYDDAIAAIDASDAIGKSRNDIMFDGSIGIGNALLRAVALGRTGRKDEALALLDAAQAVRPHALTIANALERVRNDVARDLDAMAARGEAAIMLHPNIARALFPLYMLRGMPEKAAKLSNRVSLVDPKPIGGWTISGEGNAYQDFRENQDWALRRAYVQAATGDYAGAKQQIAAIQTEISEFVGSEPVPDPGKTKVSKSKQRDYDTRKLIGSRLQLDASKWQNAVTLRQAIGTASYADIKAQMKEGKSGAFEALLDQLRLIVKAYPTEAQEEEKAIAALEGVFASQILKLSNRDLPDILPRPESLAQFPRFAKAGDGFLLARENGFSQAKEEGGEARTIRFGTFTGTAAMADEMVLRAVADYAQHEGKDAFILLSRRTITRTTTTTGLYGGGTSNSGYEAQVRTMLINSSAVPPEYADQPERILLVKDVLAQVMARHGVIEAQLAAAKAQR